MWSNRLEDAFLTTGYSCNWKHAVSNFKCHASSAPHKEATEKISLINCNVNVAQQMERQLADEKASARRALHAVAETLLTLAHTGCAIRGHEDDEGNLMAWLQLRAGDLPDLKQLMRLNSRAFGASILASDKCPSKQNRSYAIEWVVMGERQFLSLPMAEKNYLTCL